MKKYLIGIDEVGRGPVAGPVAVGAVAYEIHKEDFLKEELKGAKDSKKMSEKKREEIFGKIEKLKKEKKIFAKVSFVSAKNIDKIGITTSIQKALDLSIKNILKEIEVEKDFSNLFLRLDGGLKFDQKIKNQETIIKGDQKEFSISLASIVAKVLRDKKMIQLSKKYPEYFLEKHKGYGTKKHMEAIKKNGLTEIHRKSFLKKFL